MINQNLIHARIEEVDRSGKNTEAAKELVDEKEVDMSDFVAFDRRREHITSLVKWIFKFLR